MLYIRAGPAIEKGRQQNPTFCISHSHKGEVRQDVFFVW